MDKVYGDKERERENNFIKKQLYLRKAFKKLQN